MILSTTSIGTDSSQLSPCLPVVHQKKLRSHYVATFWKHVRKSDPYILGSPESYGWQLEDRRYLIKWYEGPELPERLDVSLKSVGDSGFVNEDENDDDVLYTCASSDDDSSDDDD